MLFKYVILACGLILILGSCNPQSGDSQQKSASTEINQTNPEKVLARRWFDEVINQRNVDAITDIYDADYVHHGPEGAEIRGLEAVGSFAKAILAASDDRHAVVEHQVAEGQVVVTRFTSIGHQTGIFQGMQPTGKLWTTEGIVISRIENGKIIEDWEITHHSGL